MSDKIPAEAFYDKFAEKYDSTSEDPRIDTQYLKEAAKIFCQYYPKSQGTILDLGCGTGLLKDFLPGTFEYTGIDISKNMLRLAAKRNYKTIHQPLEDALTDIPDSSYDFIFALGCLLFVEHISQILSSMNRIARRGIFISFDQLPEAYMKSAVVVSYDHSQIALSDFFSEPKEDYLIRGWTSPTTGIRISTRMVYISQSETNF